MITGFSFLFKPVHFAYYIYPLFFCRFLLPFFPFIFCLRNLYDGIAVFVFPLDTNFLLPFVRLCIFLYHSHGVLPFPFPFFRRRSRIHIQTVFFFSFFYNFPLDRVRVIIRGRDYTIVDGDYKKYLLNACLQIAKVRMNSFPGASFLLLFPSPGTCSLR